MTGGKGSNRKILVIEDDRELIDLLTLHLNAEGYQVAAAADGEAGLRAYQAGDYGLVILDWMLPTMTGIDTGFPTIHKAIATPIRLKGIDIMTVSGWTNDLNCATSKR